MHAVPPPFIRRSMPLVRFFCQLGRFFPSNGQGVMETNHVHIPVGMTEWPGSGGRGHGGGGRGGRTTCTGTGQGVSARGLAGLVSRGKPSNEKWGGKWETTQLGLRLDRSHRTYEVQLPLIPQVPNKNVLSHSDSLRHPSVCIKNSCWCSQSIGFNPNSRSDLTAIQNGIPPIRM